MKRFSTLLSSLLLVCFAGKGFSQALKNEAIPAEKSLLWKISGNHMENPSFIFGTMHLICEGDYLWTEAMKKSLNSVKEICFEMDMDDVNVMKQIAVGMMDTTGVTLETYFNHEDYQLLSKYLTNSLRIDISLVPFLKPTALISLLATHSYSCLSIVSYENNLLNEAQKMNLAVTGLETPAEQLALLERIPTDSVVKEVIALLNGKEATTSTNEYSQLVNYYKTQDIQQLYLLMKKAATSAMDINAFIDERNKRWIDRMEDQMDQQAVFFAVGAGHLWGENGILQLLQGKGYKVEAVK